MWCWRRKDKVKCSEKVNKEDVLEQKGEEDDSKQYPL
jgi:hypothetical protein